MVAVTGFNDGVPYRSLPNILGEQARSLRQVWSPIQSPMQSAAKHAHSTRMFRGFSFDALACEVSAQAQPEAAPKPDCLLIYGLQFGDRDRSLDAHRLSAIVE